MSPGPHELLEGLDLGNGWQVIRRLSPVPGATGGSFSCGYLVRHESGSEGFLKALDFFSGLIYSADIARDLQPLLDTFNFERDLLDRCKKRRLSRIVTALDHGTIRVNAVPPPLNAVFYIIFELAEGDVRGYLETTGELTHAWAIRVLHHVAVALQQLHSISIAHQDLKPSNVLQFQNRTSSKLADLGRAAVRGQQPPHYTDGFAGDRGYAPPELLYGAGTTLAWNERRLGCDLYHLGSLISSLFTTVGMTSLILMELDQTLHFDCWRGSYDDALLFLRPAFDDAVQYVAEEVPIDFRADLRTALLQLCDPDPRRRGHPRDRGSAGNPFGLQRYVSLFARLATQASWRLPRVPSVRSN